VTLHREPDLECVREAYAIARNKLEASETLGGTVPTIADVWIECKRLGAVFGQERVVEMAELDGLVMADV